MHLFYIPLFLLFSACLFGCSHSKSASSSKGYDKITFGSGGGFTGLVKSYTIDGEGKLTIGDKKLADLPSKTLKKIHKKVSQSGAFHTQFNQPGNFYHFIETENEGKTNRIVWSDKEKAPEKILSLYQYLTDLTKPYLK